MLQDIGISIDPNEWASPEVSEVDSNEGVIRMPSKPFGYTEENLPIFLDSQIEWFEPELAGFFKYEIHEDLSKNLGFLNYEDEKFLKKKRIHFYNRKDRFIDLFMRWFNFRIKCSFKIINMVKDSLVNPEQTMKTQRAYNTCRIILKRAKLPQHYSDIPYIIWKLGGPKLEINSEQIISIKHDFISYSMKFNKNKFGRKRFPLYQHLLVELMEIHGIGIPYFIPKARTKIRRLGINNILNKIKTTEL